MKLQFKFQCHLVSMFLQNSSASAKQWRQFKSALYRLDVEILKL